MGRGHLQLIAEPAVDLTHLVAASLRALPADRAQILVLATHGTARDDLVTALAMAISAKQRKAGVSEPAIIRRTPGARQPLVQARSALVAFVAHEDAFANAAMTEEIRAASRMADSVGQYLMVVSDRPFESLRPPMRPDLVIAGQQAPGQAGAASHVLGCASGAPEHAILAGTRQGWIARGTTGVALVLEGASEVAVAEPAPRRADLRVVSG